MNVRNFQLELLPVDGEMRSFKIRENGKLFAAGELRSDLSDTHTRAVAYRMVEATVAPDDIVHLELALSGPKLVTWSTAWVREHHVRITVTDNADQEIVAGFELLFDYSGAREDGIKRHELYDTLDETLTSFVETLERPLRATGYEHNTASVVALLHREITQPILDREFPVNTQEMN